MIYGADLAAMVAILPILAYAAYDDHKNLKIRNKYVLAVLVVGIARILFLNDTIVLYSAFLSALMAGFVFYAGAYHWDLLGGGDVKMMIALSFALPYAAITPFYFGTALSCSAWCVWRVYNKLPIWRVKAPLAPFLLSSLVLSLMYLALF